MHVWHLVLRLDEEGPLAQEEVYALLYLKVSGDDSCVIVLKCMTPNGVFPLHRNVSLTHLQQLLAQEHGFIRLVEHIWTMVFARESVRCGGRLCYAWNRVMCRDFLRVFPELHGSLQDGDYQLVKSYAARNGAGSTGSIAQNLEYTGTKSYFGSETLPSMACNNTLACDNVYKHPMLEDTPESDCSKKRKL